MKVFVMVDMEGISGIVLPAQVLNDGHLYGEGRKYMTGDVNACVQGCFEGGATQVRVRDAHCTGHNLVWNELDPRAEYIQGRSELGRQPGIAEFDALILLGYHAMAGTPQGILEHTMSSAGWQNFWLNGRKAGEIAQDAGIAGDHGVPTIMVSGDDHACREARRFIPGVVTAEVKKGLAYDGGILLSQAKAHALIRKKTVLAMSQARTIRPLRVRRPVKLRLELVSRGKVPAHLPHVRVIDGRTYEVSADSVEKALQLL